MSRPQTRSCVIKAATEQGAPLLDGSSLNNHAFHDSSPLRAGVVGAGVFGRHHASKYARLADVKLVGFADPDAGARRGAEAHFHVPATADWHNLLGRVDVVSVCSPARTHAPIVRRFLEAGAHVLVEKPIAVDVDEADELIALAEANDCILTVGHQERFVFARAGLLDYEDAPLTIDCVRTGPWTGRGTDVSVVLDLMIHDLDLVHRLVPGRVTEARARGRSVRSRMRDEVAATVTFENGSQASLLASRNSQLRRRALRAVYHDGEVEIDFLARRMRNTTGRPLRLSELPDPLAESVADFVQAVRAGRSAMVRPEEARMALETALLIDEAAGPVREPHASDEVAAYA